MNTDKIQGIIDELVTIKAQQNGQPWSELDETARLKEQNLLYKKHSNEDYRLISQLREENSQLRHQVDKLTKLLTGLPISQLSDQHIGALLNGDLRKKSDEYLLKEFGDDPDKWATSFMEEMTFGPTFDHALMSKWFGLAIQSRPPVTVAPTDSDAMFVWVAWHLKGAVSFDEWKSMDGKTRVSICDSLCEMIRSHNRG